MSGAQVTIKKKALLELLVPRALVDPVERGALAASVKGLLSCEDGDARETEDRRIAFRVARIYGRTEAESESDLTWWREKGGFI